MGRLGCGVRRGALALILMLLAACTAMYQNHGYVPRDEELTEVVPGQTTREELSALIGEPSSTGVLTGGAWYYVGSRFKFYGPREPQEVDRQVVAISFDAQDRVANIERFGMKDGHVIVLSRRVTDSSVQGVSFLRQLLGNIGNVDAARLINPDG